MFTPFRTLLQEFFTPSLLPFASERVLPHPPPATPPIPLPWGVKSLQD